MCIFQRFFDEQLQEKLEDAIKHPLTKGALVLQRDLLELFSRFSSTTEFTAAARAAMKSKILACMRIFAHQGINRSDTFSFLRSKFFLIFD